ncbi:MAG: hydroxypyruvate isomerase, partial [Gemmataceae bacterium]
MSGHHPTRRQLFQGLAGGAALAAGLEARAAEPVATNQRVKQSIVQWCYAKGRTKFGMDLEAMCLLAKKLGCPSIELAKPEDWATLKKHGLVCAIAGSHGFEKGMNNPAYHDMCIDKMSKSIELCADAKFPSVITFTGFRENIADDDGVKNCVAGYKKIIGLAEK